MVRMQEEAVVVVVEEVMEVGGGACSLFPACGVALPHRCAARTYRNSVLTS